MSLHKWIKNVRKMMVGNSYSCIGYLNCDGVGCQSVKPDQNRSTVCVLDRVLKQIANYFFKSLRVGLQRVDLSRKFPSQFKTFLFTQKVKGIAKVVEYLPNRKFLDAKRLFVCFQAGEDEYLINHILQVTRLLSRQFEESLDASIQSLRINRP